MPGSADKRDPWSNGRDGSAAEEAVGGLDIPVGDALDAASAARIRDEAAAHVECLKAHQVPSCTRDLGGGFLASVEVMPDAPSASAQAFLEAKMM